jgi:hypothetical protein
MHWLSGIHFEISIFTDRDIDLQLVNIPLYRARFVNSSLAAWAGKQRKLRLDILRSLGPVEGLMRGERLLFKSDKPAA